MASAWPSEMVSSTRGLWTGASLTLLGEQGGPALERTVFQCYSSVSYRAPMGCRGVSEAMRLQPAWLVRSKCRVCLCSCQASAVGVQTRCSSTKLWCTQLSSTGSFFFVPVTSSTGNAELLPRIHLQEIPLPLLSRASSNSELWPLGMRHCFSLDSSPGSWVGTRFSR